MRKIVPILAMLAGAGGIGGTGHAATLAPPAGDDGAVVLYAYAIDRGGVAAPLGRCEIVAAPDACRRLEAAVAEVRRKAAYASLSKGWSGERLGAFGRLVTAADAFAHAVAVNETDGADDRRAAEMAEKDAFERALRGLVAGQVAARGDAEDSVSALDAALNAAYARVMTVRDTQALAWGSVDKAGIRRTERAWLAYRDAFVAFAGTLDAPDAAATIKTELTRRRAASLEGFLED